MRVTRKCHGGTTYGCPTEGRTYLSCVLGLACQLLKSNISSMSGMTHSGCVFTPPELLVRSKDKGKLKDKVIESKQEIKVQEMQTRQILRVFG